MDHFDNETSDEVRTTTVASLLDEESSGNLFEELAKSVSTNQEPSTSMLLFDHHNDIFGDTFSSSTQSADQYTSSTNENELFFSIDDVAGEESSGSARDQEAALTLTNMEKAAHAGVVSASSSLFDDLLDFSSPKTSEMDQVVSDNTADLKPVPAVDLLFGVDDDLVSPIGFQSEVKAKAPDILDFVDVPCDLPEISSMDVTDSLAYESLTDGWDLLTDVTSSKTGLDQSPDVIATFSGLDTVQDTTDDEVTITVQEEDETDGAIEWKISDHEKHAESADDTQQTTDGDIKEKTVDSTHDTSNRSDKMKDSFQDIDFSVLELPESSNLNFDHFKHKRNISQKGSIANRKKPKRATIQPASEDSMFLDSTEPKPQKIQNEDELDSELSLHHNQGDKAEEVSGELSEEASPTRKLAGGIKIPGLLEGLNKSKAFTRAEKTSPVTEPESKPEIAHLNSASNKEKSPTTLRAVNLPAVTSSPPLIRPKPVVLPRVLPKPATKTLKETQNQTTASGNVSRASSFRTASSASGIVEKSSLLTSPVTLSRSASVKVTNASASKDLELSSVKEEQSPSIRISKLLPPKPELKKPLSPAALRSVNKTPPPVPVKPSVAAKPSRASLGWSSSFSGGKSPLLPALKSETKTLTTINKEQTSDAGLIINVEKKTDSANTTSTEKKYASDNKQLSSGFSSVRKPLSFVPKNTDKPHPLAASGKIDTTVESVKSASGESESPKNVTVSRIPSVKSSLPSGFVARTGFKAGENYANLEAEKAENLDADEVFDTAADKTVSSVNILDSSTPGEKFDSANNVDEILHRRKSSISGITPVKSPLTSDKFPSTVMPRKGSITGSAYNPIGFRSALGSSDSDQRSRTSSVSSSVEGVALASDSANLLPSVTAPSPKPRTDSQGSSVGQRLRNGSFKASANEHARSSPDKFLEGGSEITTKSGTLPERKPIPDIVPNKSDEKKKNVIETKGDNQKPTKPLQESTILGRVNGSPSVTKGGLAADKTTSPWNIQLKKVEKKETPKPEPAVKTNDPQPVSWRQQLSVRQKGSVPPKITEKPKQDNTPEWAKASMKRRQRLIESGVIRGDS